MRQLLRFFLFVGWQYLNICGSNGNINIVTENPYHYKRNIRITCNYGRQMASWSFERTTPPLKKLVTNKTNVNDEKYKVDESTGRLIFTIIEAKYEDEKKYRCCGGTPINCSSEAEVIVIALPEIKLNKKEIMMFPSLTLSRENQVFSCKAIPAETKYYHNVSVEFNQPEDPPRLQTIDGGDIVVDGTNKKNDGLVIKCIVTKRGFNSTQSLKLHIETVTTAAPEPSTAVTNGHHTQTMTTKRTNAEAVTKSNFPSEDNVVVIAAAAAGTGVVLIVSIVVVVLCYKHRRNRDPKLRKDGAPVRTEDQAESTNAALLDKGRDGATADDYTYASVVPKSKRTVDTKTENDTKADLSSSVAPKSERQDHQPEQTSNDTGLMYVELDLTASAAGTGSAPKQPRDNATTEPGIEYGEIDFSKSGSGSP